MRMGVVSDRALPPIVAGLTFGTVRLPKIQWHSSGHKLAMGRFEVMFLGICNCCADAVVWKHRAGCYQHPQRVNHHAVTTAEVRQSCDDERKKRMAQSGGFS